MIEVIVATAVLIVGILGTLGILDAARSTASTAQRTSAADAVAQREIEAMRALPYGSLYDCSVPTPSPSASDPRHWISGSNLLVQQDYRTQNGTVLSGVPAAGEPFWSGACTASAGVDPGPSPFTSGNVRGTASRFVTAQGVTCDPNLGVNLSGAISLASGIDPASGTTGLSLSNLSGSVTNWVSNFCGSGREGKRLTVAITVGSQPGGPGPHQPVYLSALVPDPTATTLNF